MKTINVNPLQWFREIEKMNVLVIGDVMVDSYLWGHVDRISPEAPVPIVSVSRRENRLGGAANVAINVRSLGANPILVSVIGQDEKGGAFIDLLKECGMSDKGIIQSPERVTTTKFRILGNNTQMLRVDEEMDKPLSPALRKQLLERITGLINAHSVSVIIFEDYDKGVIDSHLITEVSRLAAQKKIPISVDPKRLNFNDYHNITLFKPNLKELREGLRMDLAAEPSAISPVAEQFRKDKQIDIMLVTLADKGMLICYKEGSGSICSHIQARKRSISDVSGAGDTVISVASIGLALGLPPMQIAELANIAGGIVCEDIGVVPINRQRLKDEAILYFTQK